jgi:tRNA(fMet)-specific endonuclease VapC
MRPTEEAATDALLQSLEYYGVTWDIARQAGLLRRDYARKGVTIALADATIAAVVLSHQLILVTDNAKHFPIKGLQLYPLPQL